MRIRYLLPNLSILITMLLLLSNWSCALKPRPIPVDAGPDELRALVGEWEGEYSSEETGRHGSISFTLSAGQDTAYGQVVMIERSTNYRFLKEVLTDRGEVHDKITDAYPLTIQLVRLSDGKISGTLSPYRDPECGCVLTTTFYGELSGEVMRGTFVARAKNMRETQNGEWVVVKQKK